MRAMILAAGRGERLRPLTDRTPKPLVEVGGEPLLGRHIRRLRAAGFQRLVINTSHLAGQIRDYVGDGSRWGLTIRVIYEGPEPLETGGGLRNALPLLGPEPFLAINGDIVTDYPFERLTDVRPSGAHLVLVDNPAWRSGGDFLLVDDRVTAREPAGLTFSGIAVYRPALLAGPERGPFSVVPLLEGAIEAGTLTGEHYRGLWHDTGTAERLEAARAAVLA
ncbi:MAG: nucleotidyltransferase family protein [Xanthomonadales bacterium]|nr:nucleotidyltransferase family protein [Xanthomonadales bacterium]